MSHSEYAKNAYSIYIYIYIYKIYGKNAPIKLDLQDSRLDQVQDMEFFQSAGEKKEDSGHEKDRPNCWEPGSEIPIVDLVTQVLQNVPT